MVHAHLAKLSLNYAQPNMKTKQTKLLAFFLVLTLLVTAMSGFAFATEDEDPPLSIEAIDDADIANDEPIGDDDASDVPETISESEDEPESEDDAEEAYIEEDEDIDVAEDEEVSEEPEVDNDIEGDEESEDEAEKSEKTEEAKANEDIGDEPEIISEGKTEAKAEDEKTEEVVLTEQTISTSISGITVTVSGSLPEGCTLSVIPVSVDDDSLNVVLAVDISIYNADGSVFEPEAGTISTTITSDAIVDCDSVYYVPEDGEAIQVAAVVEDDVAEFEANHFSIYVVTSTDLDAGTSTVTVTGTYHQEEARSMLSYINAFRTSSTDAWYWNETDTEKVYVSGLGELVYDYDLEQIAMLRAAEIAISYSHTRPDGTSCFTVECNGVTSAGENIWYSNNGDGTALTAFTVFREEDNPYATQGHRRLMLSDTKTSVGIACVEIEGYYYWVMEFGWDSYNTTSTGDIDGEWDVETTVLNSLLDESELASHVHTYDAGVVTTEATCTTAGVITYTCTDCGATYTESIAATGHTYSEGLITRDATCTEDGSMVYTCTVCGANVAEIIPATGHSWDVGEVTTAATCTVDGVMTYHCTVCDATKTEAIPATGHTWGEGEVTKEATCTEDGEKTYICSVCGTIKIEVIPAAHTWDEGVVTTEATCTEDGVLTYTCTVCGEIKTEAIVATGHSYDNGVVTTAATATTAGVRTYTCVNCGDTYTETIAATGTSSTSSDIPKTGDNTDIALWVGILAACAMGAGAVTVISRKKIISK